jgi:hypothetical protein
MTIQTTLSWNFYVDKFTLFCRCVGREQLKRKDIGTCTSSADKMMVNSTFYQHTYSSMKEGSLFCFVVMRSIEPRCFRSCYWSLWKALDEEGCMGWFHDIWTCGSNVLEYWMIFSLKIKLNHSWKFWKNWNVPLVFLERSCWARFNGIYLVRFGLKMWEMLILKWFVLLKIQINSPKSRFWNKKSVEDVGTFRPMA